MYQDFVDIFHTQKKDDLLNLYMDLESLFRIERTIDPHLRVIDFDLLLLSSGIFKVFRYFSNSRCCEGAIKQRKLPTQIFVNISHPTCNGLEFFRCEL